MRVNVQGGTNAGCKAPLRDPSPAWRCLSCGHVNKGYHARCMTTGCNRKREG